MNLYRYYRALRNIWREPAQRALSMARDRAEAERLGITFHWEPEFESVEDVFGEASRYECENCGHVEYSKGHGACCDEPCVRFHDTGVYVDPTAEHLCCVARGPDDEMLDSLGMIDGAWDKHGMEAYGWLVECQMAGEAIERLGEIALSEDTDETEETLA